MEEKGTQSIGLRRHRHTLHMGLKRQTQATEQGKCKTGLALLYKTVIYRYNVHRY